MQLRRTPCARSMSRRSTGACRRWRECRAIGSRPGCEKGGDRAAGRLPGRASWRELDPARHDGRMRGPAAQCECHCALRMGRKPVEHEPLGSDPCVDTGHRVPVSGQGGAARRAGTSGRYRRPDQGGRTFVEGRGSGRAGSAGQPPIRMPWSPTLDGVDGLVACVGTRRLVAAAEKVVRHENPSDADVRC